MKCKIIEKVAPVQPQGMGERITCSCTEDALILDCYRDKGYLGRHGITLKGEYKSLINGEWKKQRFQSLFGYSDYGGYYYSFKAEFDSVKDSQTARDFFHANKKDVLDHIDCLEREHNRQRAKRSRDRKERRIEELMDQIPTLPDDFEAWADQEIFRNTEYLLKKQDGIHCCTACGKPHDMGKVRHNQKVKCPDTGKEIIVKNRIVRLEKKAYVMVLQKMNQTQSVARHFKIVKNYGYETSEIETCEEIRLIFSRIDHQGGKSSPSRLQIYYGQMYDQDEFEQKWWDSNPINRHCQKEYCYPKGIDEAVKGTEYESCAISEIAKRGWMMEYNKIMAVNFKSTEYFVKAGLQKLLEDIMESSSVYDFYGDYANIYGNTAEEVLKISMQSFHRLRQRNGGKICLQWLQWAEACERRVQDEFLNWAEKNKTLPKDIEFILDRMSPVQIAHYLDKQQMLNKNSIARNLETWKDCLSMAKRLGMDTQDEIVYRDKNMLKRHDDLAQTLSLLQVDIESAELREKYPHVEENLKKIRDRYQYQNDGYLLTVPQTIAQIMDDGRQLHHCGGASQIYYERIEMQETYIMFLRRVEEPEKAFYTLEVEPGGVIRQKRSEYNRQPNADEIKSFLQKWQQELKKRMSPQDGEAAKRSQKMRMEEMEKLKAGTEREQQLHGILVTDLMEIAG